MDNQGTDSEPTNTGHIAAQPSDHTTMTQVIDGYRENGFTADLWAEEGGRVRCGQCSTLVAAADLRMHSLRRLEGASDPADMTAVVAATCPSCEAKGTLVLAYGPMASDVDSDVLVALDDQRHDDVLPGAASPAEMPDA